MQNKTFGFCAVQYKTKKTKIGLIYFFKMSLNECAMVYFKNPMQKNFDSEKSVVMELTLLQLYHLEKRVVLY